MNKINKAFTLAEVLITLGIIGIVAALTLPSLIAKYQKTALINQLKKQHSVVNQAYTKALWDYGGTSDCFYGQKQTSCNEIFDNFIKNLKVVKKCERAVRDGCTPMYKGLDEVQADNGGSDEDIQTIINGSPNFTKGHLENLNAYVLPDGAVLITYHTRSLRPSLIDINGKKGPNKWGYDLFGLDPAKSSLSCRVWNVEKGGFDCRNGY